MNQHKLLTGMAIASFLIPSIGLAISPTNESAVAAEIVKSKRAPFYSKAGRFSIDFPSEPKAITGKNEANGDPVYTFNSVLGKESLYQAIYSDISTFKNFSRQEVQQLLIGVPTGFAQGLQAKLTNVNNIRIGKNTGIDFKFARSGQIIGRGRAYIVGERVYMVTSIGNSEQASSSFLNSFRLR
jgi:hypothetical protein